MDLGFNFVVRYWKGGIFVPNRYVFGYEDATSIARSYLRDNRVLSVEIYHKAIYEPDINRRLTTYKKKKDSYDNSNDDGVHYD